MLRTTWIAVVFVVSLAWWVDARAQEASTGSLTGIVEAADRAPLVDVTVTVTSPALQGERSTVTDVNGVYALRGLPPGAYEISFALNNYQPATHQNATVNASATIEVNARMVPAAITIEETVTVTAEAPRTLGTSAIAQTYSKREVDALPIGRRPIDIAELAPGLTTNTPTVGQTAIAGAFAYDSTFLINGVDTNDNINGVSNNLFIEDAILETSALVHGIPAAYGRFTGGVIVVVTKSGGNSFSGSVRENLSNPKWIGETPRERENGINHADVLGRAHEATFGGPLLRDRLWFFAAGRYEKANTPLTFAQTGGGYTRTDSNRRGELKLTGRLRSSDTLQVTYIGDFTEQAQGSISATRLIDSGPLLTRELPNRLLVASYSGLLASRVFANAQISQKRQRFVNNGGIGSAITDSPFLTLGASPGVPGGFYYHAPYLDASDPESRNNHQFTGSLAYLLSTPRAGTHDLKVGAESFVGTGVGGNSQSPTDVVFVTDYLLQDGRPVTDANGRVTPVFTPGDSQIWTFDATRGASIDLTTRSFYIQDRWTASPRLTFDLGLRLEKVHGEATGDVRTVDTTTMSPRLAAAFDIEGDGRTVVDATYSRYAGKYSQTQFALNTNVGHPSEVDYVYTGPAGQGFSFAPGFDRRNYSTVVFANVPTANILVAPDARSPLVNEVTLGVARRLGKRGSVKATYAARSTTHFVEDFVSLANGTTNVPLVGTLTNRLIANTDVPTREYRALILQGQAHPRGTLTVGGHYTLQIRNNGTLVGEAANAPGLLSPFGDYPEILGPALDRLMPDGRLEQFQRHKLRVYGIVAQDLGRFGSVDLSPIWRVNSGTTYSLTASLPIPAAQLARNPGYPTNDINPSVRETVYFGERGEYDFKGYGVLDLAATYSIPVWKSARPWIKMEIYNVLNNQKLIAWDRTVTVDRTTPLDANGIPTGYIKGPRFGQATSDNQYPQPYPGVNGSRAFRMAFGLRF